MRLFLKYLIVSFLFILQTAGICCQPYFNDNKTNTTTDHLIGLAVNGDGNDLILKFSENSSRPLNHGEKVDTTVLPAPVLSFQDLRSPGFFNLQLKVYSRRKSSLNSHSSLFAFSKSQFSLLVNILRI